MPHAHVATLKKKVAHAVCYHIFAAHDVVHFTEVAAATGLSTKYIEEVAYLLISRNALQARINHVEGRLTRVVPPDAHNTDALLRKTLHETDTAMTYAETQLQLLSIQRHLVTASLYSIDPQSWDRAALRVQDTLVQDYR
ncbi:hypothetical protein STCU_10129 [Strigomonas culicis]|uniref:PCI domain-containing protein n=1 Tax=Strigomonas culicis TaxID=28005 RepID=S9TN82_9TRYP|nr:hypothetical protein STCU_10129 [Strigomonas culicis]|eukprot:EPY18189.1 hypothetical protein STCU_10129 [Strigomonas culicis]